MKVKKIIQHICSYIILMGLITSCVKESMDKTINSGIDNSFKTLELQIDIPEANKQATRGMNEIQTSEIDLETLRVFLFKKDIIQEECKVIAKKASGETNGNSKKYKIVIRVPESVGENIDLHFFANSPIVEPTKDQSLQDFLNSNTFTITGKWDIEGAKKIPMWGAITDLDLDSATKNSGEDNALNVKMLRSLARIDLIKKTNETTTTEFSILEAYIYNSNNKGYLAPLVELNTNAVTQASVPSDVTKLDPIFIDYNLPNSFIGNSGIALIPEQKVSSNYKENIFVVVKIRVEGGKDSFYRINIQKKNNVGELELIEILRNHRYIISIADIKGDGSKTIDEAINSGASNIDTNVVVWDENINYGLVSGSLYFGLNTNNIKFDSEFENQVKEINFQTNLTNAQLDEFAKEFKWQYNKDAFEITLDKENHKILLRTKSTNTSHQSIVDNLIIVRGKDSFTIEVEQPHPAPEYTIDLASIIVNGLYQVNTELTPNNNIVVKLESKKDLTGSEYELYTEEIDYVTFRGKGVFNSTFDPIHQVYYSEAKLIGTGTPKRKENKIFNIKTNSKNPATFPAKVKMAYSPKFIVAIENKDKEKDIVNGTSLNNATNSPTIPSNFRTSVYNFGLEEYSTVKVPPLLDIPSGVTGTGVGAHARLYGGYKFVKKASDSKGESIENILAGSAYGMIPDIVILGGTITLSKKQTAFLVNYLLDGGCVLYMQTYEISIKNFFRTLYKLDDEEDDIRINNIRAVSSAPSAGNRYQLTINKSDPIYNGPFGNLNGKCWGDSDAKQKGVRGLPQDDIIVYSDNVPVGLDEDKSTTGATMFRHIKHNIFFIGCENFIANSNGPGNEDNKNPQSDAFDVEKVTFKPVTKQMGNKAYKPGNTTYSAPGPADNSMIIANILAYLIDQAEFNGINSKK